MNGSRSDLARVVLAVIFIGGLIAASIWILRPFLGALIWSAMIVIATWPMLLRTQAALGGRRGLAVLLFSIVLIGVLVVPLAVLAQAAAAHVGELQSLAARVADSGLPPAPEWLGKVPVVGTRAVAAWQEFANSAFGDLLAQARPYVGDVLGWLGRQAGSLGAVLLQFVITVVLCSVLYTGGESWARWARQFSRRLAGDRGDRVTVLAGQAIRGVALGVVVTAVLQSALGGIGLAIAGVPFAGPLTLVMFVLCIAQLGPIIVLLIATAWAYANVGTVWGTFLLVWSIVVGLMDNFVRPALIRKGADLPFLLIFAGVVGGLVAFGLIGIFVGPVVLAVAYTLLTDWVAEADSPGTGA